MKPEKSIWFIGIVFELSGLFLMAYHNGIFRAVLRAGGAVDRREAALFLLGAGLCIIGIRLKLRKQKS